MNKVGKKAAMPVLATLILSGCVSVKDHEPIDGKRGFDISVNKTEHKVLGTRGIIPLPYDEPQDFEVVMADRGPKIGTVAIDGPTIVDFPMPDNGAIDVIVEPDPVPPKEVELIKYVVKKGDSLWRVADMYGVSHKNLARINNLPLKKPLQIGQVLEIPEGGKLRKITPRKKRSISTKKAPSNTVKKGSTSVQNFTPKAKQSIPADGKYTVKSGDSLWTISSRFGISIADIKTLNDLKNSNIFPGKVLVLKSGLTQPGTVEAPAKVVKEVEKVEVPEAPVKPEEVKEVLPVADVIDPLNQPKEVVKPVADEQKVFIEEHEVQANEKLQDIADLLVVSPEMIKKYNPGVDWNNLKPGQVIKVPIVLE